MTAPNAITVQQLADYLAWQVGIGNGALRVRIDRRGLAGLPPGHNLCVGIPPRGEETDGQSVFIRAVF